MFILFLVLSTSFIILITVRLLFFHPSCDTFFLDQSGMMGFSYGDDDLPAMCFNAAKNYQLGWYSSQTYAYDPSADTLTRTFIMNGIQEYDPTNGDDKLISLRLINGPAKDSVNNYVSILRQC